VAAITLAPVTEQTIAGESTNPQSGPDRDGSSGARENPTTDPKAFEPVEGTPAKRNKETGEIWERDKLHKDHYEVYKNKKKVRQWQENSIGMAGWKIQGKVLRW